MCDDSSLTPISLNVNVTEPPTGDVPLRIKNTFLHLTHFSYNAQSTIAISAQQEVNH